MAARPPTLPPRQRVKLSGEVGELRQMRIELDDLVEREARFLEAAALDGRARGIQPAVDTAALRALLELGEAFLRDERWVPRSSGF